MSLKFEVKYNETNPKCEDFEEFVSDEKIIDNLRYVTMSCSKWHKCKNFCSECCITVKQLLHNY